MRLLPVFVNGGLCDDPLSAQFEAIKPAVLAKLPYILCCEAQYFRSLFCTEKVVRIHNVIMT